MSFNERIKEIQLKEVLFVIIITYLLSFVLRRINGHIDYGIVNLIIIFYFIFRLKDYSAEFKLEVSNIFSKVSFKDILFIIVLNIFFSYGMIYLSNGIVNMVPFKGYLAFLVPLKSLSITSIGILSLISVILISPIVEELIFRGVFLNKLGLFVPTTFAILISSLLFASLHSFGSIFSAFVFAVCMAILYLKSENILVPILGHFLNNFIGESIYHIDYTELLFTNSIIVYTMSIFAAVSFILLLRFIFLNLKNI